MSVTMTDCSSMQGSSTSSSSDVVTLTTASSWCAIPPGARIRILRLIRPHTRRILVTPDVNPSYGFAVRGGKEFGTGFFVSVVERNSEADLKGLRVGDQILRINGFRVEDAVHKEFIQFVNSQDRLTLKVRGVGMLPIKDKENDRLSWNVVKAASVSNTPSESSYNTLTEREKRNGKDINVVLNVAPRTKLGLGICKGPEWKPGIFVQFTKEKSIAREAGLRPGDQILSVNSIDFSDVLFSEAVAVMKSSNKLDIMIRTGAGCDLFPGESSGYNSSASSVTGDQSPCWADAKSKRLTAVCEEPLAANWNEAIYANNNKVRNNRKDEKVEKSAQVVKEANKTIIKLSEHDGHRNDCQMLRGNISKLQNSNPNSSSNSNNFILRSSPATSAATPKPPPAPPKLPTLDHDTNTNSNDNNEMNLANGFNSGSSLSSAITEELKKRKEKLQQQQQQKHNHHHQQQQHHHQHATTNSHNQKSHLQLQQPSEHFNQNYHHHHHHSHQLQLQHQQQLHHHLSQQQLQQQQKSYLHSPLQQSASVSSLPTSSTSSASATNFSNTIMRRQQLLKTRGNSISRANSSATYSNNERNLPSSSSSSSSSSSLSTSSATSTATTQTAIATAASSTTNGICSKQSSSSSSNGSTTTPGIVDQHSALMDEFKKAHQRMFRNGFREIEAKTNERQDALKRTSMMEDDICHRSTRNLSENIKKLNEQNANGAKIEEGSQEIHIPPPPPQFANSPPKSPQQKTAPSQQIPSPQQILKSSLQNKQIGNSKPPASPVPDYEHVQMRPSQLPNHQRHTLRLGTVTIGEYDHQGRKEPGKFEFLAKQQLSHNKNLSKSQNNLSNGSTNGQTLQSELQNTLKKSNLKKTNGSGVSEHQAHCNVQANYEHFDYRRSNNMGNVSQKLQNLNLANGKPEAGVKNAPVKNAFNSTGPSTNGSNTGASTGILKNSGRNPTANGYTKNHEKTISFGN